MRQRQKQRQRENWENAGQGANGDKCRKAHSSILKFKLNLAVSKHWMGRKDGNAVYSNIPHQPPAPASILLAGEGVRQRPNSHEATQGGTDKSPSSASSVHHTIVNELELLFDFMLHLLKRLQNHHLNHP